GGRGTRVGLGVPARGGDLVPQGGVGGPPLEPGRVLGHRRVPAGADVAHDGAGGRLDLGGNRVVAPESRLDGALVGGEREDPHGFILAEGTSYDIVRRAMADYLFTSESVTEGHPDKVCDQVSDAILDAIIASDPHCRVACETLTKTGLVVVAGEITTDTYVDMPRIVRETVRDIGYS